MTTTSTTGSKNKIYKTKGPTCAIEALDSILVTFKAARNLQYADDKFISFGRVEFNYT